MNTPESKPKKLIFIIGDYSSGVIDDALKNNVPLTTLRSSDSADARVLNYMVQENPDAAYVITLPVPQPFNPGMASALNAQAVKWAFDVLENPTKYPQFKGPLEIHIVNNVAPGIITTTGARVAVEGRNDDREPFVAGTVTKDGKTVYIGGTASCVEEHGHTFGHIAQLEKEGYKISDVKAIGGEKFKHLMRTNGQFRSRVSLGYAVAHAGKMEFAGKSVIDDAKKQFVLVDAEERHKQEIVAAQLFKECQGFLPIRTGNARDGFVTVVTEEANVDAKLKALPPRYSHQLVSVMGYERNEPFADKQLIATLSEDDQRNYRETRQAHLASTLANEFDRSKGVKERTVVVDSRDSQLESDKTYDVTLTNGAHIVTANPKLLALTVDTVVSAKVVGGEPITDLNTFLQPARKFAADLKKTVIENDPYRNVKLGMTYGDAKQQIAALLAAQGLDISQVSADQLVELTIQGKTGIGEAEEVKVCFSPSKSGSFSKWGHPKLSAGSTVLNPGQLGNADAHQAELFTPGCPTAGYVTTAIPGVTSFAITQTKVIGKNELAEPKELLSGGKRKFHKMHAISVAQEGTKGGAYAAV